MRKSSDEYWNGPKGEEHRKSASEISKAYWRSEEAEVQRMMDKIRTDEYWNGPKGEEHRKSASERKKQWNKDHPEEAAMIQASAIDGIRESWANDDGTMRQRASDTSTARYVDDQEREKQSVRLKEYCASLTEEEMCGRLDNSLRNCDHKKRGDAISKGKRGKSNNQQENMGRKYASWSDEEFNELLTRYTHQHVIDRTIRLRDKWKEIIRLESLKD